MPREIICVVGARPNFMKMAPMLRALKPHARKLTPILVHTGQHYDTRMSEIFFDQLDMPWPDISLEVGSGSYGQTTARVLERFEEFLAGMKPSPAGVIVVGDVDSTLACSLAAAKLGISVAHVEAGLRSFDITMPEEINRKLTDALCDLLLVTEEAGLANLRCEGIPAEKAYLAGNVMIDTLLQQLPRAKAMGMPERMGVSKGEFALVTLHRPSNVDRHGRLGRVVELLLDIASRLPIVFPVHPRTASRLEAAGLRDRLAENGRIRLLEPLGYRENLGLLSSACFVLTDSGGLQDESAVLDVPCLTLRPNTERPVTVKLGTNTLVGEDFAYARQLVREIIAGRYKRSKPIPFWDGHAAERIAETVIKAWA